jgi:hypothetical protein
MAHPPRKLAGVLEGAARHYPALVVTGPRRAVKTTLFRRTFPKAKYIVSVSTTAIAPGVEALDVRQLVADLTQSQ